MEKYNNFINGKWIDSEAKEIIKVEDPATAKVIGEIACAISTRLLIRPIVSYSVLNILINDYNNLKDVMVTYHECKSTNNMNYSIYKWCGSRLQAPSSAIAWMI